ncbi:MAG TPA: response regulator transcription factor [Opitutaceae bacterium]
MDTPIAPIRIIVVEDYPVVLEGLVQWLSHEPLIKVLGEAGTLTEARDLVDRDPPEILLMDLMVNGADGIGFIREMRERHPDVRILVLSMHDEMVYSERVVRAGASGFVMKQQSTRDLLTAIETVHRGELYLNPRVAGTMLRKMLQPTRGEIRVGLESLTDRELHVYQLIGSGLSTRLIAEALKLSVKTIDAHRENIKNKLGINSAADLARQAATWITSQRT